MELIVNAKRVIMVPGEFFEEQSQERDIKTGFIIMGIVFLVGLVGNLAILAASNILEGAFQSVGLSKNMAIGALLIIMPIAFILSLLLMSALCGIMHFIATLLGGSGTYKGFLACFLFMQVISIIFIPFSFIIMYMTMNGIFGANFLTTLLSLVEFVWFIYLLVLAIKKVYTISIMKSIMVIITTGIIAILLLGGIVVLFMPTV